MGGSLPESNMGQDERGLAIRTGGRGEACLKLGPLESKWGGNTGSMSPPHREQITLAALQRWHG